MNENEKEQKYCIRPIIGLNLMVAGYFIPLSTCNHQVPIVTLMISGSTEVRVASNSDDFKKQKKTVAFSSRFLVVHLNKLHIHVPKYKINESKIINEIHTKQSTRVFTLPQKYPFS